MGKTWGGKSRGDLGRQSKEVSNKKKVVEIGRRSNETPDDRYTRPPLSAGTRG